MVFAVISGTSPSASLANSSSVAAEKCPEENSDGWGSAWLVESTHGTGVCASKASRSSSGKGCGSESAFPGQSTSRDRKD